MNCKEILIDGNLLKYNDESLLFSQGKIEPRPISIEEAKSILKTTKNLFDTVNLKFSLAFGTLLGAVRDNGLISNDEDVDIFIWDEKKLRKNLVYFQKNGLEIIRIEKGKLYSFRHNGSPFYIDVYILRELQNCVWSYYCYSLNLNVTPKKYFKEYEHINFLSVDCLCPKEPEKILAFWYGKNWRIPQKDHFFYYEVRSAFYWHHPTQIIKDLLRFILRRKHLRS